MAIAYFIPDQAKLLAGQRPSSGANNSSSRSTSNNQPTSRLQQTNPAHETAAVNNAVNRGYGTTINISVPTFNNTTTQEPLGCWDFLTQVFCHALRFYHESSQLQPTVIQISVNFNTQVATSTATSTAETAASTPSNHQQTPTAEETSASAATTEERKHKKLSKRKN